MPLLAQAFALIAALLHVSFFYVESITFMPKKALQDDA